MYTEDQLIAISALQHYLVCPRQCALIHLEQTWLENAHTAEGRLLHERVDSGQGENRGRLRLATALPLRSLALGLSGVADMVEFHKEEDGWRAFPVEYKKGAAKKLAALADRVQLCAQGLCLEEMLGRPVPEGALYYGRNRRRTLVVFDESLRQTTREAAQGVHRLLDEGRTPAPVLTGKCKECSLKAACLPEILAQPGRARDYLEKLRGS